MTNVSVSAGWAALCALFSVPLTLVILMTGMNGYGLVHVYPWLFLPWVVMVYASLAVVPCLLAHALWKVYRAEMPLERLCSVVLPINGLSLFACILPLAASAVRGA